MLPSQPSRKQIDPEAGPVCSPHSCVLSAQVTHFHQLDFLKVPELSRTVSPAVDQVFKHINLWGDVSYSRHNP